MEQHLPTLLVVDDDPLVRLTIADQLRHDGYAPIEADSLESARQLSAQFHPDGFVIDVGLPDGSGLDLVREARLADEDCAVLVLTGRTDSGTRARATALGATDYLTKPLDPQDVSLAVSRAMEGSQQRRELRHRREAAERCYGDIVGDSPPMRELFDLLRRLEGADQTTVLILGESGTGKELVAREIHRRSARSEQAFLEIDCTGLAEQLVQSQLFGHERGAFTGAAGRKAGLFEVAGRGTVFLDEIGELGLAVQSQLLRALESRRFKRLGGVRDIALRARVLAATNRDLAGEVQAGRFREDLYYRLNVIPVPVPPLRERLGDLGLLSSHLLGLLGGRLGRPLPTEVEPAALAELGRHDWPGNVRELRNVLERVAVLSPGNRVDVASISMHLRRHVGKERIAGDGGILLPPDGVRLDALEDSLVLQAWERARGNQTAAARLLGVNRYKLRYKLQKLGKLPWPASRQNTEPDDPMGYQAGA